MSELKLADLGEGMHEAEVVEWLVKEGDTVKIDQTVVKVETDKAIVEIPSPVTGRVTEIRVPNGEIAKVGDVLVVFDAPNAEKNENGTSARHDGVTPSAQPPAMATPALSQPQPSMPKHRVLAAPAVRKLAFELGVDLEQVTPSLSGGRVSLDDVKAYAARPPSSSPATVSDSATASVGAQFIAPTFSPVISQSEDERQPLTGLRKRIAERMERSWRTIPHATAFGELDGGALIALRESLKPAAEKRGVHLTYMPLLIKLLIPVLKEFPIFNASLDEEKREIIYRRSYHIGVAAATPEGLLVPVLRNADRLTLVEIANNVERLIEGAKKRTLALAEVSGSTFTLNNVGSFGGSTGTPIINYPEVAILAVGRLQEQAVVRQGTIIARPIMPLALSFDHRLIDGALAGAFLARFKELVENPQQLMLDMV
ncbi:MAG TPA: dihydrolipoamide acetyltransferase family protein [Ktedonobacteraceae bacterium]|nr:dihydrolipoamide acetyltransferase family protein [Ktedonobacteraceae bacterium]